MIDPIAVKKAIKDGQLKIYIARNKATNKMCVYLADVLPNKEQGDTVIIYELKDEPQTDVYEYHNGEWVKPDCPWK